MRIAILGVGRLGAFHAQVLRLRGGAVGTASAARDNEAGYDIMLGEIRSGRSASS